MSLDYLSSRHYLDFSFTFREKLRGTFTGFRSVQSRVLPYYNVDTLHW
jgi:hypothetical protein